MRYIRKLLSSRNNAGVNGSLSELKKQAGIAAIAFCLLSISVMMTGCGSGGGGIADTISAGASPQVVSGVAATGAPLAGEVRLKDSSSPNQEKATVIGSDGSFAFDVTKMQGPFLLKATGTVNGAVRTMYSFADAQGTANVNPLADVAVAAAASVDDFGMVYDNPSPAMLDRIKSGLPGSVAALQFKLNPLLAAYSVATADPIKDQFDADHTGLDGVFDNVRITLANGTLTITNATSGAVIFSGKIGDVENGKFTDNDNDVPKPGPRPTTPTGVAAVGGDGQVTISWNAVSDATSYNIFWSTKFGVDGEDDARKIKNVASPYVQTGLAANTTYYYVVRSVNKRGQSAASAQVSATTSATTPPATVPAAPTGVMASGGTKQVSISWSAVSGATSYNLYWSTTSGVTTANGTKISGVTSPAIQTGLPDNTTYFYIVTAVNGAGESSGSVQVAATTLNPNPAASAPAAPTGVTAVGGTNQVTLSWTAVMGADSYNVYWSTTAGVTSATGTKISGATSPFVHTGLAAGSAYFYVVTAVNRVGESAASSQATATVAAIDGAALYTQNCGSCHGPLASSTKRGATAAQITSALATIAAMQSISLTSDQIAAIAAALK